jgi:hypothetical protein
MVERWICVCYTGSQAPPHILVNIWVQPEPMVISVHLFTLFLRHKTENYHAYGHIQFAYTVLTMRYMSLTTEKGPVFKDFTCLQTYTCYR